MYTPLIDAYGKSNNIYIQSDFQISTIAFAKSILISVLISLTKKLGNQLFFAIRFEKHGEGVRWGWWGGNVNNSVIHTPNANMADRSVVAQNELHESEASEA